MGEIKAKEKYQIIHETIYKAHNQLNVSWLCEYAKVHRSGYYKWEKRQKEPSNRERRDRLDFDEILKAYNHRGYDKGVKGIYMSLLRGDKVMNQKKIRRLMRKYGLFCPIRKPNPYKKMLKALAEASAKENLLQREFKKHGPRMVLLTDITYLFYGNHEKAYMSSIKDAYTNEILAWAFSKNMEEDFVLETIHRLVQKHGNELKKAAFVHSDQGIHYKIFVFQQLLKDEGLRQSMSRKGNCWDNAPQESFHGHMKDEAHIESCQTFDELINEINNYVDYYNNERYQWNLAKLAPSEYYRYCITGVHPLSELERKKPEVF